MPWSTPACIAAVQATAYGLIGIWPFMHLRSFMAVTGPKTDTWLVHTVGMLILVRAGSLGVAAGTGITMQIVPVALLSPAALTGIDSSFGAVRRSRRIHLLDAALEVLTITWWVGVLLVRRHA